MLHPIFILEKHSVSQQLCNQGPFSSTHYYVLYLYIIDKLVNNGPENLHVYRKVLLLRMSRGVQFTEDQISEFQVAFLTPYSIENNMNFISIAFHSCIRIKSIKMDFTTRPDKELYLVKVTF